MSAADPVRSFIALTPTPDLRAAVAAILRRCKKAVPDRGVSWVREENLHITLRFLGMLSRETLDALRMQLEGCYPHVPAFGLRLHGIGMFPSRRRPRVLSLTVEADGDRMEALRSETDAACERVGLEQDPKPFQAHMTLARFRSRVARGKSRGLPGVPRALADLLKEYEKGTAGEFHVESVSLFESRLTGTGPVYTCLKEFRLDAD
ncbi:MAG: RNA 2',3'-cyclic phosphodiesterase [Candidatus Hydrogenedentes bacterium]|nr:RNA 2',3'-cyclic phosphodiesterase [Candidatus Hydrogenedentota bacterium]